MIERAQKKNVSFDPEVDSFVFVDPSTQTGVLVVPTEMDGKIVHTIEWQGPISTGAKGIGNVNNSGKTPPGFLQVTRWNGAGQPLNMVLRSGHSTGRRVDVLYPEEP